MIPAFSYTVLSRPPFESLQLKLHHLFHIPLIHFFSWGLIPISFKYAFQTTGYVRRASGKLKSRKKEHVKATCKIPREGRCRDSLLQGVEPPFNIPCLINVYKHQNFHASGLLDVWCSFEQRQWKKPGIVLQIVPRQACSVNAWGLASPSALWSQWLPVGNG